MNLLAKQSQANMMEKQEKHILEEQKSVLIGIKLTERNNS
jgi:hypothetical protein